MTNSTTVDSYQFAEFLFPGITVYCSLLTEH